MEEIKSWQEISQILHHTNEIKSVLLGNGFSLAWDYKKFNQQQLKLDYLEDLPEENVEACIEALQNFDHSNGETYKKTAQEIIHNKVHADFMRGLFNKLPQRISSEKAKPFVDFLKLFNNYFTLNYDPLVYFLFNKFKKPKEISQISNNQSIAQEDENQSLQNSNNTPDPEEIKQVLQPVIEKVLNARWYIESEGERLLEEEINDQSHTFIRNKLITVLKRREDTGSAVENIITTAGNIKKEYNNWFNDTISSVLETPIKESLKVLEFNDGFLKQEKKLKWSEGNVCNYYHIHGAYHICEDKTDDNNINILKIASTSKQSMMDEIRTYMEEGSTPISILKGNSEEKKQCIENNEYLKACYESLKKISGTLIVLGVSFADNDNHIVKAIVENTNLEKIYIGVYKAPDESYNDLANFKKKFKDISMKVVYFEVNDVFTIEEEITDLGEDTN